MSNTYKHITHSADDNDIAWLILDVKGEAANVIGPELIEEMTSAIDTIK